MKFFILITILCSVLYCEAQVVIIKDNSGSNKPLRKSDIEDCYGTPCPLGTVRCNTTSTSSPDHKKWITTVQCIDFHGMILKSVKKSSEVAVPALFAGRYDGYFNDPSSSSSSSSGASGGGGSSSSSSSSSASGGGFGSSSSSSSSAASSGGASSSSSSSAASSGKR